MFTRKRHQSFVSLTTCIATCRHIGIVGPHQFHMRQVHLLQFVEIGLPTVIFTEIIVHNLCAQYLTQRRVCGITRIGHEHLITRIDESQRHVQDAFLATDKRLYLCCRVQVHIIPTFVEVCHRLTQFGCSHRGLITMRIRLMSHLAKFLYGLWRRGHIRTAYCQTDNISAFCIQLCNLFQFTTEIVFLYC